MSSPKSRPDLSFSLFSVAAGTVSGKKFFPIGRISSSSASSFVNFTLFVVVNDFDLLRLWPPF